MHEITDWLEKLGMAEYARRFVENDIETSVLRYLTDQDLKELGVSLGHRRKILAAITDSTGAAPELSSLSQPSVLSAASPSAVPPQLDSMSISGKPVGERRYLTVMFCDLVDSTSISAQLDAEDWRDLVSSYLEVASAEVKQMGGHVAKKLGDGLMVLFGYPVAQERDAERAARAALGIQRALTELNRRNTGTGKPVLSARIGLEAGPVVIDSAAEIFGDAPNIAARVQAVADPGEVLVTAPVQRQIAGLFVVEVIALRGSQARYHCFALFGQVAADIVRGSAIRRPSSVATRRSPC